MKNYITFILLFLPSFAFNQIIAKTDSIAFKNCNAIEISANKINEELYQICGNFLLDNGLVIDFASKDFNIINTKPLSGNYARQVTLCIYINNQKVKIIGFLNATESNLIQKVRLPNGNFNYLQNFASQLNEILKGKITYLQEKYEFLEN